MAELIFPAAAEPGRSETFMTIDALAAWLLRQRPGRALRVLPCTWSIGDGEQPGLSVFALTPAEARRFDQTPDFPGADRFAAVHLGVTAGPRASDPAELEAALHRIRSVGGLAA